MITHCPRCGYSRTPTDRAPEDECPSCGIKFQEWLAPLSSEKRPIDSGSSSFLAIMARLMIFILFTSFSYWGLMGSAVLFSQLGHCGFIDGSPPVRCVIDAWQLKAYTVITGVAWAIYFWMGAAWIFGKGVSRLLVVIGIFAGATSALPWLALANMGKSASPTHVTLNLVGMFFVVGGPTIAFSTFLVFTHWRRASTSA